MRAAVHSEGHFVLAGQTYRCAIGKGGVRGVDKQEGDGATPLGLLPIRRVLYRADRLAAPDCNFPIEPIGPNDAWCENPALRTYNTQIIRLPDMTGDRLWRDDHLYDVIAVLGWNDAPVVRNRGSAIFLHLARPDYSPTDGCVALNLPDLSRALAAGLTEIEVVG